MFYLLERIIYSVIGSLLKKFVQRISYSHTQEDTVSIFLKDDLFENNQFPFIIQKVKFCLCFFKLWNIKFGIGPTSFLIYTSPDCDYSSKPKYNIIQIFLHIANLIFGTLGILLSLFFSIIKLLFGRLFKAIIYFLLKQILKLFKHINISFEVDFEIPVNNHTESLKYKLFLDTDLSIKINSIYDSNFSITINKIKFGLQNQKDFKILIQTDISDFEIIINQLKNLTFNSKSNISVYFNLFDIQSIIKILDQIKLLPLPTNKNTTDKKEIEDLQINLNIPNIDFYIIKSNLPLLLLQIKTKNIQYNTISNNLDTQIEANFCLKHLCHKTYNVISNFSTIIKINRSDVNIIVSPIQLTMSSFLIKEILAPECNDTMHLSLDHQYKKLFFQNNTHMEIELTFNLKNELCLNDNNNNYTLNLVDDTPIEVNEEEIGKDIKVVFNDRIYYFSIDSLYSPIFLDQNLMVNLKTENGINLIHFSSPYLIRNKLNYDIQVYFNEFNIINIENGKEKYIPCGANFSLSNKIRASMLTPQLNFNELDFTNSNPILFYDSEKQINPQYQNFYSTCLLNYDSQRSTCSIDFVPYITITNYLPKDLYFIITNVAELYLKQGEPVDISYLKENKNPLQFFIDLGQIGIAEKVVFTKLIKPFRKEICLYNSENKNGNIIIECVKKQLGKKKLFSISIYSPLILKNETSIPLSLKISNSISHNFIRDLIFYSSKSVLKKECFINLPFIYENLTKVNSKDFGFLGDISQIIPLQHIRNDKINLFLTLSKEESSFENTSTIHIVPYLKVYSNIHEKIVFNAIWNENRHVQMFTNECEKGDNIILGSTEKGNFDVQIRGYQACKSFNIFNIGSEIIRFTNINDQMSYILIKLDVKKEENGYCCYVSYPSLSSDISIENKSDAVIYISQQFQPDINNFIYHPIEVKTNSELIIAKEQPFLFDELANKYFMNISFNEDHDNYLLSFEENCKSKIIGPTNYCYDFNQKEKKIVIYNKPQTDEIEDHQNNINDIPHQQMHFSILLTEIQCSFIDKEMQELFLINILRTSFSFDEKIKLSIEGFSLNDMYTASISPVVIHGTKAPFLNFEIIPVYPLRNFKFHDISIQVAPLQIFIDTKFIVDLIALIFEWMNYFPKFNFKNDFFANIFIFSAFSIKKVKLNLTIYDSSTRKYRCIPDNNILYYLHFPFSGEIEVELQDVDYYNIEAPLIDFFKTIPDNYMRQFSILQIIKKIVKFFISKLQHSKTFDDFLQNKFKICNDNILEFPRRIPRCFPNGKIPDIPLLMSDSYPDIFTQTQFLFQKNNPNEQLIELYENGQNILAIFNNMIYIKNTNECTININDIKSIESNHYSLIFVCTDNRYYFSCKSKQDVKSIMNRIVFIQQKSKCLLGFDKKMINVE